MFIYTITTTKYIYPVHVSLVVNWPETTKLKNNMGILGNDMRIKRIIVIFGEYLKEFI